MMKHGAAIQLSATDLVGHLNCRHLTDLDVEAVNGKIERPHFHDPLLEILAERGARHERDYLAHLASKGLDVVQVEGKGISQSQVDQTLEAMRAGTHVIAQATFLHEGWGGRADVLLRVPTPSALGDWSYEVIDAKLARETKGGTVLQLSLYSDLLSLAQGKLPEHMHVVTPGSGFEPQSYRTAAYAAYYRYVRRRLEQSLAQRTGITTYPDPKEHCEICRWRVTCEDRRRRDDHLCLVAGITKIQISEFTRRDANTATKLSRVPLPLPWKPDRGAKQSYERTREQARVQIQGRETNKPVYETLPPAAGLGLSKLPAPSKGDLFFDLEGDPFVGEGGLEYLFGYVSLNPDTNADTNAANAAISAAANAAANASPTAAAAYTQDWAFTRADEERAFKRFVDFVMARWAEHPDMHIYHYAPYEPGALKRLMGRYATREDEIDRMLRGGLLVDLYAVVRQGIRASVESYSIKKLEPFFGFERPVSLVDARSALARMQACLELDDVAGITEDIKRTIAGYNRDDCISAQKLRDWLEEIRADLITQGTDIPRPIADSAEPSEEVGKQQQEVAEVVSRLMTNIPADIDERSPEQQARWILANTLDWHRRELKSVYWEFFRLRDLAAEDLYDEKAALAGLSFVETVADPTSRTPVHRYRFPPQDVELRSETYLYAVGGELIGTMSEISIEGGTINIKKVGAKASVHPTAVFGHKIVRAKPKPGALLAIGKFVARSGISVPGPYQSARDILLRRPPQIRGGEPLRLPGEGPVAAAVRIAPKLAGGVLAIQGPPGAGKTFTAARMICELVKAKKRVGITANSHKVVRKLLDTVVGEAAKVGVNVQCIQKPANKQADVPGIRFTTDNDTLLGAIGGSCQVAGGTAWLWARDDAYESVDVLFVDEAAQMSLADVLAVSQACQTLVLVGDPQQLDQPMQGTHPEGTGVSALDHLLAGKVTISEGEGLFLDETWRLHPDICAFTSELFYESRLQSRAGLDCQTVKSTSRLNGAGLRFLPVRHEGNQSSSPEEAERIRDLVTEILSAPSTWTDRDGIERPVNLADILIIAPYNAQVFELQERLPGAHIGTVDKFQGQEAAIVIYSMTTSSHADAPRGMDFLYSLNRLNVASSRSKCLCVLVGSPTLFEPECRTPEQMRMANAFCRYLEMSTTV